MGLKIFNDCLLPFCKVEEFAYWIDCFAHEFDLLDYFAKIKKNSFNGI